MAVPSEQKLAQFLSWARAHPSIHIRAWDATAAKLSKVVRDGSTKLHVISDFDMTLTCYWVNGQRNKSSHSIISRSPLIPESFRKRSEMLYNKYYPIEMSPTVPMAEKVPAMIEWWTAAHEDVVQLKLARADIAVMVKDAEIPLRRRTDELLMLCKTLEIPFLIFSAGIGDVIKEVFRQQELYSSNMHVVSNTMIFDERDVCVGFKTPLIHTFNKNEGSVKGSSYGNVIEQRVNVILMGDSLGDLRMSEGLTHENQIAIGFLNHDREVLMDQYLSSFDIVVTEDESMEFAINFLSCLLD
ncbi:pyrimidine 5'-nucleotidase [Polychytrium aggregatum]|uniref:pyrimidine 5'-nucleotidase n=1 Tax=Polychytrium aggregatum TaxID=110093 RepID=UPI0022FE3CC2|nr:pyrimidine 5'-nucleotidase [Polychytrium aggregatum]KAI9207177.1 pyrimidine 5'-nucleotidase [Polychytrium aggregatum]